MNDKELEQLKTKLRQDLDVDYLAIKHPQIGQSIKTQSEFVFDEQVWVKGYKGDDIAPGILDDCQLATIRSSVMFKIAGIRKELFDYELIHRNITVSQMVSEARRFLEDFDNPFVYFKDENIMFEIEDDGLIILDLVFAVGEIVRISVLGSYAPLYPVVLNNSRITIDASKPRVCPNLIVRSEFGESLLVHES